MLPESIVDLPAFLAQTVPQSRGTTVFNPPTDSSLVQMLLMWFHFVAGIVWIGHLYYFNFVNVSLMKVLDAPTRGKVVPQLMPRALFWFRWGAVVTVFVGLTYYAMYILAPDVRNANAEANLGANTWVILLVWLLIILLFFVIQFFSIRSINSGYVLAAVVTAIVLVMAVASVCWLASSLTGELGGRNAVFAGNRTISIGIGGALGIMMLLNVWGIIWPNQKRIIAWTWDNAENGTPVPPESAGLARKAFLASRTNTWLSIPMLFFMGASQYFPAWG